MEDEIENSEAGPSRPSSNELRLGRRVLDLEKERDALSAELAALKRLNASTTIPVLDSPDLNIPGPITIPHELIPTLSLLRSHIYDLTRDNEALRYTFLGSPPVSQAQPGPVAGTSASEIQPPAGAVDVSMTPTPTTTALPPVEPPQIGSSSSGIQDVDLADVVKRVKELILENTELGEMVLDAGRSTESEWQRLIDDAKRVIESLESDLEHHASVVESQKLEIEQYKSELESLRSAPKSRLSDASSYRDPHEHASSSTSRSHRSQTVESRQSGKSRDDKQPSSRHGNDGRSEGGRERDREEKKQKDRERERERNKERRGSERDKERRQSESRRDDTAQRKVDDPPAPSPQRPVGLSIKGSHQRQTGDPQPVPPRDANGVDDRSWKRRR